MLNFTTDQFYFDKEDRQFSQESSSLGLSARNWNSYRRVPVEQIIDVLNPDTKRTMRFKFEYSDMGPENEVAGWNYESVVGVKLLIIND